jgi:Na+-translocating ferredoxin:NAD+ oxidoreductase subunit B
MGSPPVNMHFVCTHEEAGALIDAARGYWVSDCGCRAGRANRTGGEACARSRLEVCLGFSSNATSSPSAARPISRGEAEIILQEARAKRLVARPYRDEATRSFTDGICFCCDDCCGYFLNPQEACDRGALVEETDLAACHLCLACVEECRFGARLREGARLTLDREKCYGCGLCVEACPTAAVRMVPRRASMRQRPGGSLPMGRGA